MCSALSAMQRDITTFEVDGMIKHMKNWICKECIMTLPWTKKIRVPQRLLFEMVGLFIIASHM